MGVNVENTTLEKICQHHVLDLSRQAEEGEGRCGSVETVQKISTGQKHNINFAYLSAEIPEKQKRLFDSDESSWVIDARRFRLNVALEDLASMDGLDEDTTAGRAARGVAMLLAGIVGGTNETVAAAGAACVLFEVRALTRSDWKGNIAGCWCESG